MRPRACCCYQPPLPPPPPPPHLGRKVEAAARDEAHFGPAACAALSYPDSAQASLPLPLASVSGAAAAQSSPHALASGDSGAGGAVAGAARLPSRLLPVEWSLRWVDKHVQYLRRDLAVLSRSVQMTDSLYKRGRSFRLKRERKKKSRRKKGGGAHPPPPTAAAAAAAAAVAFATAASTAAARAVMVFSFIHSRITPSLPGRAI